MNMVKPSINSRIRNWAIHTTDFLHHYLTRHRGPKLFNRWWLFCACDTLAESEWWLCNHKDWYCRKFEWDILDFD
jgi:hypothetical protein